MSDQDQQPATDEQDFDQRMDSERAAGTRHRPVQAPATETVEESVSEEHRLTSE